MPAVTLRILVVAAVLPDAVVTPLLVVPPALMAAAVAVVARVKPTNGLRVPVALRPPMQDGDVPGRGRPRTDRGSGDPRDRHRRDDGLTCDRRDQLRRLMPRAVHGTGAVQRRIGQARDVRADRA